MHVLKLKLKMAKREKLSIFERESIASFEKRNEDLNMLCAKNVETI